jgi:hypothetical protein
VILYGDVHNVAFLHEQPGRQRPGTGADRISELPHVDGTAVRHGLEIAFCDEIDVYQGGYR